MENDINSKEEATRKILEIMCRCTFFKSLVYENLEMGSSFIASALYFMQQHYQEQLEVVGSLSDGLAVIKPYDVGDVDVLRISKYCFRSEDELLFEYKSNDPCFLQIPLTEKFKQIGIVPVNDKYLSATTVRSQCLPLFKKSKVISHGEEVPNFDYQITPGGTEETGETKCAKTTATPYSDNTGGISTNAYSLLPVNFAQQTMWMIEHTVCAYLLASCNEKSLSYLREILYGENTESISALENFVKKYIEMMTLDHIAIVFQDYDLLHFCAPDFDKLMKEAVHEEEIIVDQSPSFLHGEISMDLVAAIRCEGWPRTANNFLKRSRKWPSQDIVNKIVQCGYQVVPKSSDFNPNVVLDFILSFSPAEKMFAQHIPEKVREAYRVIKLCYKTTGCKDAGNKRALKTFHLKTALFWVTEQTEPSEWAKGDMLWCVQHIVEYILKCLVEKFLPSFFVDEANLLKGFSDSDFEHMIQVFVCLSENLAGYIKLALKREWDHLKMIMSKGGFEYFKTPGLYDSIPWMERAKIVMIRLCTVGGFKSEEMQEEIEKKVHNPYTFFGKLANEALSSNPDNIKVPHDITHNQLEFAKIFVHTIQALDMNLYHFISKDVEPHITSSFCNFVRPDILAEYPSYDPKHEKEFGVIFMKVLKTRIKYYGNMFRAICDKIGEVFPPSTTNNDALYIIKFLKAFRQHSDINEVDVQDLLFNLIFFCHYTKLRYHWMSPGHQILRCIREFLQESKYLMTIFFNVSTRNPIPLMMPDKLKNLLGGIEPKRTMCPVN